MKRILILLSAALVVSCSKSGNEEPFDGEIRVKAQIEGSAPDSKALATRALTPSNASLEDISFLRIDNVDPNKLDAYDFTGVAPITADRAANGNISFAAPGPEYDQTQDKTAYFRGFHPGGTNGADVKTWAVDGKTDILATDVWNAGRYTAPKTTGMIFRHELARLEVFCQRNEGHALEVVQDAFGDILSISLNSAYPTLTYTYATNAFTYTGTPKSMPLLDKMSYKDEFKSIPVPEYKDSHTDADVVAGAMLCPINSKQISLHIKTEKGEFDVDVSLNDNFEKGKYHRVTLSFVADPKSIEVFESQIEDWTAGATGSADVTFP